jgi:hypothetical protein
LARERRSAADVVGVLLLSAALAIAATAASAASPRHRGAPARADTALTRDSANRHRTNRHRAHGGP